MAQLLVIWTLKYQPSIKKMSFIFSYGQSDVDFFLSCGSSSQITNLYQVDKEEEERKEGEKEDIAWSLCLD